LLQGLGMCEMVVVLCALIVRVFLSYKPNDPNNPPSWKRVDVVGAGVVVGSGVHKCRKFARQAYRDAQLAGRF
jgi:hypothetical protein